MGKTVVDLVGIHMLPEGHLDLTHPWQSADRTPHVVGHQEREIGGTPVGRQAETDRYAAVLVDRQPLDEAQVRHRFIEFRIGDAVERRRTAASRSALSRTHAATFARAPAAIFCFCVSTSMP